MKLRQISFKLVSLVMVFAILFGVSATTISAIEVSVEDYIPKDENGEIDREAIEEDVAEIVEAAKLYAAFVAENYEEMYAEAHTELRNNGTIAELNAALIEAMKAVYEARLALDGYEVVDRLAETKVVLLKELALTESTLVVVKDLVNNETITAETLEDLEYLLGELEDHLEYLSQLGTEFGGILLEDLAVVLAYAHEKGVYAHGLAVEFTAKFLDAAYNYVLETAPVLYEQLVDAITAAIAYHSHEAAKLAYNWLINNPEKVIGFFDTYGDDMVDFIAEYHEIICCVLGYVGYTYGEDILNLVLDNADVIIPAVVGWFTVHGELVWDLVVVYFYAIVEYYNLGLELDFSSPEGIHAALNQLFALLGDLLVIVKDSAFDYLEALGIMEKINAQLVKLDATVRGFIGDKIAELEKLLGDLAEGSDEAIKAELEKQLAHLDAALQSGVKYLANYIYDAVTSFVDDAIRGKFTPNEDTYYVSVNGGEALYADLLAEALSKNLDKNITLDKTTWGAIDYDMLAKADLVTIGFDQNEITDFAVAQLLGYVNDLIDGQVRGDANTYVASVFVALEAYYAEVQSAAAALGLLIPDFDFDAVEENVFAELNGALDAVIGEGELNFELDAELSATLEMVGGLLADKDAEELDWSKFIPESELHYVDELRAELRNELLEKGIPETFSYDLPVLEYVFENHEALGLGEAFKYMNTEIVAEKLASVATYTFSVPVVDSLVFAIESYIYSNLEFQYNYGKLILDLYAINPEATVILLGHYNAFDYELTFGGETLDLSEAYSLIAGVSSVQPFTYALLSEKVAYVDISDAETYYETYVNAGVDNNLVNFVLAYLADSTVTDVTVAGHTYIYEKIMNILTIGCEHKYDNACDTTCNKCGEIRVVGDHVYVDGVCIHCGHVLPVEPDEPDVPTIPEEPEHVHVYDDCNDAVCNTCGETRTVVGHVYDHCEDDTCYKCGFVREKFYHTYDDCEDGTCNHCGFTRPVYGHNYSNACDAECNACGKTREVADHVYSGCTDTTCNVCGAERQASAHKVDDCADNICNVCGQNVAVSGHKFGAWNVTVEPGRKTEGKKTRTCSGCGLVETKAIAALGGISGGAIAGISVGSAAAAGAAGFAIFWFLIQKKTFAELLALVGKGGADAAAAAATAGAEAGAEAVATEAAAEATAEAATEGAAETVAEAAEETVAE